MHLVGVQRLALSLPAASRVHSLTHISTPNCASIAAVRASAVSATGLALPQGHPFLNIQPSNYWSASAHVENPTLTWGVGFGNGNVLGVSKSFDNRVWCVRGGMNAGQY
jgi:hypothetical protein